jgi:hypothetical protein
MEERPENPGTEKGTQALLFIHLKDHFTALQSFGIRNIVHFRKIINMDNYESVAKALGIPAQKLSNMLKVLDTKPMKTRIDDPSFNHRYRSAYNTPAAADFDARPS